MAANRQVDASVELGGLARLSRRAQAVVRRHYRAPEHPCGFLESSACHVDDVANDGELDAPLCTDIANDHRTEMDANGNWKSIGLSRAPFRAFHCSISVRSSKAHARAREAASNSSCNPPNVAKTVS